MPRIAIIGGGPGGLTLLLTPHKRGIPATLYEREASFSTHRHLGGTLDLGYYHRFYDTQKLLVAFSGGPSEDPRDVRPEIDRTVLRKIMLDAVPPESIKWGHDLTSIRPLGGGGAHELTFANGFTTVSDILVGADGAHSRVRPLLSPAQPIYHGVTGAEISLAPETTKLPELAETVANVGSGSMWAGDAQGFLGAQVNGDGRIRTYAWFRAGEDWKLPEDPDAGRAALLESWVHVDGVTILGHAAHLMSPFAGAGANLAMLDALELGILLKESIAAGKSAEEREAGIKAWEEARMSEGRRVGAIAARNIEVSFSAKGPLAMIDGMKDMSPELRRMA
ncbi:hypothetical protein GSI_07484 [Ganoderma sinense ZZ0214-1]|uniref:FAD-binding domain-containing protein n=1 Tax=Ganoderma sinense ZZ0214-1 TaxID=1077348 RepID=A0A2G8S965_9APHY|nr:hypothetical protein GSI_07484 [Ganoderma sinense ZZ0214-1]